VNNAFRVEFSRYSRDIASPGKIPGTIVDGSMISRNTIIVETVIEIVMSEKAENIITV